MVANWYSWWTSDEDGVDGGIDGGGGDERLRVLECVNAEW